MKNRIFIVNVVSSHEPQDDAEEDVTFSYLVIDKNSLEEAVISALKFHTDRVRGVTIEVKGFPLIASIVTKLNQVIIIPS